MKFARLSAGGRGIRTIGSAPQQALWLAALFVLLAVSGCAQVATGQGQPPYAPYSRDNECSRNFIARSCSEAWRVWRRSKAHTVSTRRRPASFQLRWRSVLQRRRQMPWI